MKDLSIRLIKNDVCVTRPDPTFAIYKMSNHTRSIRNPVRENLLFGSAKRMKYDGLSNIEKINVTFIEIKNYPLFTHLKINVGKQELDYLKKNGYNFMTWLLMD